MSLSEAGVRRYAEALFGCALGQGLLDGVVRDLSALESVLGGQEDRLVWRALSSPMLDMGERRDALEIVCRELGCGELTVRFLHVVMANGRLSGVMRMARRFRELCRVHRGELGVEVVSAVALSEKQCETIRLAVVSATGRKEVHVESRVDPTLLGGLVMMIGSRMWDASLRTQLDVLGLAMKEVG